MFGYIILGAFCIQNHILIICQSEGLLTRLHICEAQARKGI